MMLGTRDLQTTRRHCDHIGSCAPAPKIRSSALRTEVLERLRTLRDFPSASKCLVREKRDNARGTTSAFLVVKTMAQCDHHKGRRRESECNDEPRPNGRLRKHERWTGIAVCGDTGFAGLAWLRTAPFLVCPVRRSLRG